MRFTGSGFRLELRGICLHFSRPYRSVNILPGMNAGASTYAVPSPIKGSGTAWVLLGSWALSPARPTPIHPRHECRGLSALFGNDVRARGGCA